MNIMILTERQSVVSSSLGSLLKNNNAAHSIIVVGFEDADEDDTESSLEEFFELDCHRDPNHHLVIVTDSISHLWQGSRELLDIVIEMNTEEAEKWFTNLVSITFEQP